MSAPLSRCQFHQHFMNSFCAKIPLPKITNPNCKHIKAVQKTFIRKNCYKILVTLTPGRIWTLDIYRSIEIYIPILIFAEARLRFLKICQPNDGAWNSNWRGRKSTVDHLIKITSLHKKMKYNCRFKSSRTELVSARRSIVLSLPYCFISVSQVCQNVSRPNVFRPKVEAPHSSLVSFEFYQSFVYRWQSRNMCKLWTDTEGKIF